MQSVQKFSWAASGAFAIVAVLLALPAIIPTSRPDDHHGGMYALVMAIALLPISAYFFVVGLWFKKSWPGKWLVIAMPAIALVVFIVLEFIGVIPPI